MRALREWLKNRDARVKKVKLDFAGLKVEFCDRGALKQVEGLAEKGTWHPLVVFGPEGCGKTCLLYTSPSPRD